MTPERNFAFQSPLLSGCNELVLYGIRELAPALLSTNESGELGLECYFCNNCPSSESSDLARGSNLHSLHHG